MYCTVRGLSALVVDDPVDDLGGHELGVGVVAKTVLGALTLADVDL